TWAWSQESWRVSYDAMRNPASLFGGSHGADGTWLAPPTAPDVMERRLRARTSSAAANSAAPTSLRSCGPAKLLRSSLNLRRSAMRGPHHAGGSIGIDGGVKSLPLRWLRVALPSSGSGRALSSSLLECRSF